MEDVRTEIRYAIEGIQQIVNDLDMVVTDFNDVIGNLNHADYIELLKTLRKELAAIQVKSWAHKLKLKVNEEKEDKAIEEMLVGKMKEIMKAEKAVEKVENKIE
jgi:hypothetical protein